MICTRHIGRSVASNADDCINVHGGDHYQQSRFYIPGPDLCRLCGCDSHNKPRTCKAVLCSPPIDCRGSAMGGGQDQCCDFICLDHVVLSKGVHTSPGSSANGNMLTIDKFSHGSHGGNSGGNSGASGGESNL